MSELFVDLGFARVDTDRKRRCGFPEVIFGSGKTPSGVAREGGGAGSGGGGLHAEQAFEYHQPVRPGMVLKTSSRPGSSVSTGVEIEGHNGAAASKVVFASKGSAARSS